ncbi:hypothetical protein D9758_000114 [Tetrapyrgos nigripes]|uniref:Amino acid transporter transmembrane domain-containing protein n=1 Tax=Tetrapyrgos nigripes TaxID=182062 RepID=A0A8H5H1B8_9AGAR|nr:hypothetical protein D9758_000114 [Tetrapyrgos nigripes]
MSFPSSFPYGSASSGYSVRDAIASYRRAQYLVAGSTAASASDDSEESPPFEDEESGAGPFDTFGEDLEEDDAITPVARDDFEFQWDSVEHTTAPPSQEGVSFSPRLYRNQTILQSSSGTPATEGTPLLRPKVSFSSASLDGCRSITSGVTGREQTTNLEDRRYVHDGRPELQRRPSMRRGSSSSKSVKHGGQSTFGQTLFNSIAILLGIGMLSEPLAFSYAGWIAGTFLIVAYGLISCYTAKLLARIIRADPRLRSYADVGRKAFGPRSTVIISIMFCLELFAVSVILVTLYADSLHALIPEYSSNTYKLWGLFLLIPTVFLPLSVLSYTSILGIISTVMMVAVILIDGFTKRESPGSLLDPAHTSFTIDNWKNLGLAYGLFMAGFSGHAVIPSLARDMQNPEEFDTMINWAFLVATSIYTLIGYTGIYSSHPMPMGTYLLDYRLSHVRKRREPGDFMKISMDLLYTPGFNYSLNRAMLWMLVISPLSKFALTTQPLNAVLEVLVGIDSAVADPEGMAIKMSTARPWSSKAVLGFAQRVTITLLSVAVSIAVPEFDAMMGFLGAFSAFMICIVGPIAAKVALERKCGAMDFVILVVAVVMGTRNQPAFEELTIAGLRSCRRPMSTGPGFERAAGQQDVSSPTHEEFFLFIFNLESDGKQRKAALEDAYHEAGYRTGWQVLSNSFTAFIACVSWNVLFSTTSLQAFLLRAAAPELRHRLLNSLQLPSRAIEYGDGSQWCPLDANVANGWSRILVLAALGHFACCLGDTLASELGILSKSRPILITTLKPVPPGTNGGMSATGTIASICGGAVIGATASITLIAESAKCREDSVSILISMLGFGAIAGGVGSLLDSFLGATVQQTRYSEDNKKILQDESQHKGPVKVISGINVLTNNQCPYKYPDQLGMIHCDMTM